MDHKKKYGNGASSLCRRLACGPGYSFWAGLPGDWDDHHLPQSRKKVKEESSGKTVDTGLQHGTVTIIKNRRGYEVTTYRIDGEYRDGRHPDSVEFTSSLLEDLKRRDFTINAMAYSHETGIVDPLTAWGIWRKR